MIVKELSYAYPSSIMAKRLGFNRTGCYFVTTGEQEADYDSRKIVQGFANRADADKCMDDINLPVGFYSLK